MTWSSINFKNYVFLLNYMNHQVAFNNFPSNVSECTLFWNWKVNVIYVTRRSFWLRFRAEMSVQNTMFFFPRAEVRKHLLFPCPWRKSLRSFQYRSYLDILALHTQKIWERKNCFLVILIVNHGKGTLSPHLMWSHLSNVIVLDNQSLQFCRWM